MDARQRMTFNVDVNFLDSPEVLSIPAKSRDAAVLLWLRVGCWSRRKNTDGHVSSDELRDLKARPNLVRLLIRSTLWQYDPAVPEDVRSDFELISKRFPQRFAPSIIVSNWSKWQMTADDIERIRKGDRTRKQRARDAAKAAATGADGEPSRRDTTVADNGHNGHVTRDIDDPANLVTAGLASTSRRDSKKVVTEGSSVRSSGAVGSVPDAAPSFLDHCDEHRHDPDPPKCPKCRRTREQNTAAAERAAAVEAVKLVDARLRENARRAACLDCDEHGWLYGDDQLVLDPACRCTHPDIP